LATFVSEVWGLQEKARRVLQAAAVEAYGRTGMYVTMTPVMKRANISELEEFRLIAKHLEEQGWIAEADLDYGVFVLTREGIDKATV
jgi:predicted transcriptional regulator